jgi:MYXO-CTERM domain-containing protein
MLAFAPGGETAASGHPRLMALQTTFGLVTTTDGGLTWRHTCEPGVGFSTDWDPALVLAADGAVVSGLPYGLVTARPGYCRFDRPATAPEQPVIDLTVDGRGRRIVAAALSMGVAISDDDGLTWRRGWVMDRMLISTIDVAPGHPERIYATGYVDFKPSLVRSDDGGVTFTEVTRDFLGGMSPYIAAVGETSPEVLYLRIDLPMAGTMLARSEDGGRTFRELFRTANPMTGVAVSADGRTLWAGSNGRSPADGVHRSDDGGQTWRLVSNRIAPLCLRHRGGVLYACADNARDGFGLGVSRDGGETWAPLVTWQTLQGPEACPAGTPVRALCEADWPRLRNTLVPPPRDAGPADAGGEPADGGGVVEVGPVVPADAGLDGIGGDAPTDVATGTGGGGGCACAVASRRAAPGWWMLLVLLGIAVWRRVTR